MTSDECMRPSLCTIKNMCGVTQDLDLPTSFTNCQAFLYPFSWSLTYLMGGSYYFSYHKSFNINSKLQFIIRHHPIEGVRKTYWKNKKYQFTDVRNFLIVSTGAHVSAFDRTCPPHICVRHLWKTA